MTEEQKVIVLIELFNATFSTHNTRLVRGDQEPIYLPEDQVTPYHQVVFAHGYFSSALHEVAHWCIAGEARRKQVDYGYWYEPDGRNTAQQHEFERVEVKPQALEWAFSLASNHHFRVSTDNLNGATPDTAAFTEKVKQQLVEYLTRGFPKRAQQFIEVLGKRFNSPASSTLMLEIIQ